MIFNFLKNYQFTTQLSVKGEKLEIIKEAKLLGTFITDDLKWNKNTNEIVKKGYKRMQLLNRAASYTTNTGDLRSIYLTFVRSILEQSAVVWHSSLSRKNRRDLERVQKSAVKIILGNRFSNYEKGLKELNLENLDERRKQICLKFAKNCLRNEKVRDMFQSKSQYQMKLRKSRKQAWASCAKLRFRSSLKLD